ncbi:MAG: tRNA pseudouridine(55) synthase TruB [Bacilli bacterium]|nr:tRNA pseudouridine(55) synthase TruB [Bacilli bacterium]
MNGIILIDKPTDMTSRKVVDKISNIFKTKRIGHAGTLDPIATGVLVLCVGNATKAVELLTNFNKEYIASVTLGVETDTLDIEGTILNEVDNVVVTKKQVLDVLNKFIGKIEQEVPKYSAIKVNGRRLYNYARGNKLVELPKRNVEIFELSLISDLEKSNDKIEFDIKCHVSKGTYIRSLIRDIGLELGYPACMSSLRRVKQGGFSIDQCYSIEDVENGSYKILSIRETLTNIEELIVSKELEVKIRNGAIIDKMFDADRIKIINSSGDLIAIYKTYELDNSKAKPDKMFI